METESEDEFTESANAVKAMKQEGAFSLSRVKRIAFVCDAGMGSSAMGQPPSANVWKKPD